MGVWFSADPMVRDEPSIYDCLKLPVTLLSMIVWITFHFLLVTRMKIHASRANHIVAFVQSMLLLKFAAEIQINDLHNYDKPGCPNTHEETLFICFTLGYFIYDFGHYVHLQEERGLVITNRHLLGVLTLGIVLLKGSSAAEMTTALYAFKWSNPWLQIRWLLKDAGLPYTPDPFYTFADRAYLGMCFLCHLFDGAYIAHVVCTHTRPGLDIKLCLLGWIVLEWCELVKIGKKAFCTDIDSPYMVLLTTSSSDELSY